MKSRLLNLYEASSCKQDAIELFFKDYIEYRKSLLLKDVEERLYFACNSYFKVFDFDYAKWSVMHFLLEKIYHDKKGLRGPMECIIGAFASYFEERRANKLVLHLDDCIKRISAYRDEAHKIYNDDLGFLSSNLDLYITGDYLRFSFLRKYVLFEEYEVFMKKKYCIKSSYMHREKANHKKHDDRLFKDEWQNEVYLEAKKLTPKGGRVLDIGCGSGFKLLKHFSEFQTVGSEIGETLSFLKNKYPDKKWIKSDFTKKINEEFDTVICSDVIEHIDNPDSLMIFLKSLKFKSLVISTPERDSLQLKTLGKLNNLPPANRSHYREWNFEEFYNYISQTFDISSHEIINKDQFTQLVIIKDNI